MLDAHRDDNAEEKIRAIVRILHRAFSVHRQPEPGLVLALLRVAAARGLPTPSNTAVHAIVKVWTESEGQDHPPLNESELFVLTRSVVEVLRQAALSGSPLLGSDELEDAMLRLILGFLRNDPIG